MAGLRYIYVVGLDSLQLGHPVILQSITTLFFLVPGHMS